MPLTPPAFDEPLNTIPRVATQVSDTAPTLQEYVLTHIWPPVMGVSLFITLVLVVMIIYAIFRIKQLRELEDRYFKAAPMSTAARQTFGVAEESGDVALGDARWAEVIRHMDAGDENGRRRAVMEADIMLDDVITSKGYTGEGIGEKMKQVVRADINSIDDAWEAHKIRNRIAHEGGELSERDARRAISLYANVFRELGYISS